MRLVLPVAAAFLGFLAAKCKSVRTDAPVSSAESTSSLEKIPEGEAEAIAKITSTIEERIRLDYPEGNRPAKRDAHNKHHGCVKAKFEVSPDIPADLAVGAFRPHSSYNAWVRYSNGDGKVKDDSNGDGRGMAVKLTGVPGTKLLASESDAQTQDFLMINHPAFFVRNAIDYIDFSMKSANGNVLQFFLNLNVSPNPMEWRLMPRFHEFSIAKAIQSKTVGNPLKIQYWSMTPSLLGQTAVKFSARPCFGSDEPRGNGPDYLRDAMRRTLSESDACFEFLVQKQSNPQQMPVEDPTEEWQSTVSPFVKVATLTIPKQKFDSEKQMTFCENLSYTPWHSLPEHRPLGGINRARKAVYEAISTLRHQLNGVKRQEPTGNETF